VSTTSAPPGTRTPDPVETIDAATREATSFTLEELARRLTASRWLVPGSAAAGAILGALLWLVLPRTYVSESTLLPSTANETSPGMDLREIAGTLGVPVAKSSAPESHLYPVILKSERLLREALATPLDPASPSGTLYDEVRDDGVAEEFRMETAVQDLRAHVVRVGLDEETGIVRVIVRAGTTDLAWRTNGILLERLGAYLANERSARSRENREFVTGRRQEAASDLAAAEEALREFRVNNRQVVHSPDLQLVQGRLVRDVRMEEELFLELTRQLEIARIEEKKSAPILEILDPPTRHNRPAAPKVFLTIGVGLVVGLLAGALVALAADGSLAGTIQVVRVLLDGRGPRRA
jgi:uncharacterized protein involved in exopolysaccharide biosynthesis